MHRQLYLAFRGAILAGTFTPGQRLPSTRALADDLGISRTTALQAFDRLVSEGYATAQSGAGTRVAMDLSLVAIRNGPRGPAAEHPEPATPPRLSKAALAQLGELERPRPPHRWVPFAVGLPAIDQFPVDLWAKLVARRWRTHAAEMLGYTGVCGYPPLREAIARYVMTARGVRCSAAQVIVVNGAQHGVDLVARVLLDPGDEAWVEEPGYRPVRAALLATGARLVQVPVDENGLDVHEGERLAPHARVAYVTPSYQAPLGATLTLERRLALLDWSARAQAWVIEDDYNGEFRYDAEPIPALQALDRGGRVIYVGSFSKTLAPGLRVGYLVVPPDLVRPIARARIASDLHTPVPEQAVLADFLEGGHFARHIRRMRKLYWQRQQDVLELAPTLTHGLLDVRPAPAGMRLLGLLPPGIDARAVAWAAAERGVAVTPLSRAAPRSMTEGRGGLLLGYAAFDREAMRVSLGILGTVLREFVARQTQEGNHPQRDE
jgi:GntR family transcriptional regulator/MocR family aminotransferase